MYGKLFSKNDVNTQALELVANQKEPLKEVKNSRSFFLFSAFLLFILQFPFPYTANDLLLDPFVNPEIL